MDCLELIGKLEAKTFGNNVETLLAKKEIISADHINHLIDDLTGLKEFWEGHQNYLSGALIQFLYTKVISKSQRTTVLLRKTGSEIVGSRFVSTEKYGVTHCVTYYFPDLLKLDFIIDTLTKLRNIILTETSGELNYTNYLRVHFTQQLKMSDKNFIKLCKEMFLLRGFTRPKYDNRNLSDVNLIHFYKKPKKLFEDLDIKALATSIIDDSVTVSKRDLQKIIDNADYLVASSVTETFNEPKQSTKALDVEPPSLPDDMSQYPIVGVLDTAFNENCYLSKAAVSYQDLRPIGNRDVSVEAKAHGTMVDSLIVHGHDINAPLSLDDKCGYFRVKHFAIANLEDNSTYQIIKNVKEAVLQNPKIKVWNISLGSKTAINKNYISPLSFLLDKLSFENDVIFIVSGTNNKEMLLKKEEYLVGSPADHINGIVVNSCRLTDNEPATYSRRGGVLDFFIKPDIAYYGGDDDLKIRAFNGFKIVETDGTSFAAPLITRKVAYLIYQIGLTKEVAKALILDSATGWSPSKNPEFLGRGIVQKNIKNILEPAEDEIRLIYNGCIEQYDMKTTTIPIPVKGGKFPFRVRATMCYTTRTNISCGVDYTDTDVEFKIGHISNGKISNLKTDFNFVTTKYVNEKQARSAFRKWDNVKQIVETKEKREAGRTMDSVGCLGFEFTTTDRCEGRKSIDKYGFNVGLVITLKSVDNENRYKNFLSNLNEKKHSGWNVKAIPFKEIVNPKVVLEQEIKFEETININVEKKE